MTITSSPNDKYAFLFTGPTEPRFVTDLENVAQMLVEYYNYPAANIMVVLGSTLSPMPGFSGAPVTNITSEAELATALSDFAAMAAGADKTTLLYFTGGGVAPPAGTSDSRLIITGGTTPASVDGAWLKPRLNALSPSHVNVVMQQSFAGGFLAALLEPPAWTLTEWGFTYACQANEESYGDFPVVNGSFFTHAWTRALKFEPLPVGAPGAGQFADQLGMPPRYLPRLVSLAEAMAFAKAIHDHIDGMDAFSTPGHHVPSPTAAEYLGKPAFLIRDGTPWYESPDIYLTHPNHPHVPPGDLYISDPVGATDPYNNTINVMVRNIGTHPVRAYALHVELFHTGGGGTSVAHDADPVVPSGDILLPMDLAEVGTPADKTDTYEWNTIFVETSTHRCVKAEAALLASDIDVAWTVIAKDTEGQRNIDVMTTVPPPPGPPPFPGLQGGKEHIFGLENRFKEPRLFILALPEEFREFQEKFGLGWFAMPEGPKGERIPLEMADDPLPHIPFELKPGEETQFLLHVEPSPEMAIKEGIKLPFEIWVKGDWPEDARPLMFDVDLPEFAPIAGFTVMLETGASTLVGTVLDPEGKPFPEAKVYLRTVNRLQGAEAWTDGDGYFAFPDINPDVYHVWAEGGERRSEVQTVVLLSDQKEEVNLYLTLTAPKAGCLSEIGGLGLDFSTLPFPDGPLPSVFVFGGVRFTTVWRRIEKGRGALWCYGAEESPPGNWNDATVQLDFDKLSHVVCEITAEVNGHGPEARLEGYQLGGQTQTAVCPGDKRTLKLSASPGNPFTFARLSGQEAEWSVIHLE
jgi:hypothetical protein